MNIWEWCDAHKIEIIVTVFAIVALLISIFAAVIAHKQKKRGSAEKQEHQTSTPKQKSAIRQIYVTTDGYFTNRADIKKKRLIAVLAQRKDDGAVAVVKVYSEDGKEQKIGKTFIPGLTLIPADHKSLDKNSIVGREVIIGVKRNNSDKPISLYPEDFNATGDELTPAEYKKVLQEVHNDEPKHRETFIAKMRRWVKHFKQ